MESVLAYLCPLFLFFFFLQTVLSRSLGIKGIVKKKREIYMVGQTRVHVDEVEGLGNFMELEV